MRLAIVGAGNIFEHHLHALSVGRSFDLKGVYDHNYERLAGLPSNVKAYQSLDDLAGDSTVDVVLISTPTTTHYSFALRLIEIGKCLLIEKPLAQSLVEFQQVRKSAENARVPVVTLFHSANAPDALEGMREIGRVVGPFHWHSYFTDPYAYSNKESDYRSSLVEPWIDSGINALSVVGRVLGSDLQLRVVSRIDTLGPTKQVIATSVVFSAATATAYGHLVIETNWATGINHKSSRYVRLSDKTEWEMDHTAEVLRLWNRGVMVGEKSFSNQHPRLTNHYIKTFHDAAELLGKGESNWSFSEWVHTPYFAAIEARNDSFSD